MRLPEKQLDAPDAPEQREHSRNLRLSKTIREMFPDAATTPFPEMVEGFLTAILPLVRNEPIDDVPSYTGDDRVLHLFARGSFPERRMRERRAPFAPYKYLELPAIFRSLLLSDEFLGEKTPLVEGAVRHNIHGPDVDIMIALADQYTCDDFLGVARKWVDGANAKLDEKFRIEINEVPLSQWNGEEDARVYISVNFEKRSWNGEFVSALRLEVGEAPYGDNSRLDGRFTPYHTQHDRLSTARLYPKSGRWYMQLDGQKMWNINHIPDVRLYFAGPVNLRYVSAARVNWKEVLWPQERLVEYFARQYASWNPEARWRHQYGTFSGRDRFFELNNAEELEHLKRRREELVRLPLLAATYNWLLWMEKAFANGSLSATRLGELLSNQNIHVALLSRIMGKRTDRGIIAGNLWRTIESASLLIQPAVDTLELIGPLTLVRLLKEVGALTHDTPVTIQTFIDLVDPVGYWETKLNK